MIRLHTFVKPLTLTPGKLYTTSTEKVSMFVCNFKHTDFLRNGKRSLMMLLLTYKYFMFVSRKVEIGNPTSVWNTVHYKFLSEEDFLEIVCSDEASQDVEALFLEIAVSV